MAIYFKNQKISTRFAHDTTFGIDPNLVYTKQEIDEKLKILENSSISIEELNKILI